LYLSKKDSFDHIQKVLDSWCEISGAKFNIEKTEVIPIGTTEHRHRVVFIRKLNKYDQGPLIEQIHIIKDGESIRMLGAWMDRQQNKRRCTLRNNNRQNNQQPREMEKTTPNPEWKKTNNLSCGRRPHTVPSQCARDAPTH
jgi:hypothetical protein